MPPPEIRRCFGALLCAIGIGLAEPAGAHPINAGWRGGVVDAPESTLPTYEHSLSNGVDWVEFDIWLSADGIPVIHHDPTLNRTTDGTGFVYEKTLAELKTLDAGSWFSPAFAGTRIPTVTEGLELAIGRGKVLLDIKDKAYVPTVVQTFEDFDFPPEDVVVWNRFGTGPLWKALMPASRVITTIHSHLDREQQILNARSNGDLAVDEQYTRMTPEYAALIHAYGLQVVTHTVLSPYFQEQIDMGVDILIVAHPVGLEALLPAYTPRCMDGIDNDGDGLIDHPDDPGCFAPEDDGESKACSDGIDNDGDGLIDYPDDPGCYAPFYTLEDPACSDGIDNNGDGDVDHPADAGCIGAFDQHEQVACANGIDDDGDGLVDYPEDPGCLTIFDDEELGSAACDDGIDNDDDGLIDYPDDPGCDSGLDDDEFGSTACDDGIDNDDDGLIDYPDDPGCFGLEDPTEMLTLPVPAASGIAAASLAAILAVLGLRESGRRARRSTHSCR